VVTTLALTTLLLTLLLTLAASAQAASSPFHPREKSLDVSGLNHACGAAVDSKGDLYLSNAGESKVNVYNSSHTLLTSIADANQPCGLAVTSTGNLYVSERTTGEVVRFKPNAFPFSGTPTYGSREVIDASGKAKGIAVDRFDDRLYVAEGTKVAVYSAAGSFEVNVGEGTLTEASGVAAFSYPYNPGLTSGTERYLWVADAQGLASDQLYLFRGQTPGALTLHHPVSGAATPAGSFGFGAAGAYLAADPGNRDSKGKCVLVGEQACTAGHLFLYDAAHKVLDEFDASGEYLDQTRNAAFADAEPTAVAIDRSGGAHDGALYVTAGAGAGAKAIAFAPFKAPSRKSLKKPSEEAGGLSQELKGAKAVATDSRGNVYAAVGASIQIFSPTGAAITSITDSLKPFDLAVDSTGKVYVLDEGENLSEEEVTYYTPSEYPPKASTTYTRREEPIETIEGCPKGNRILRAIALNPGPGTGKDHLFVLCNNITRLFDSAANGSTLLKAEFAEGLTSGVRQSLSVNGSSGIVYFGINEANAGLIVGIDEASEKVLSRFENTGAAIGKIGTNPSLAVDQSNGHVLEFDGANRFAHEYDAAGSVVAEFGKFTESLSVSYRVAVDNSCALHEPPLAGEACEKFDPANGTTYIAFADTSATHPPYNGINAFGPLTYANPSKFKLTVKKPGTGSGTVTSSPAGINCGAICSAEYLETEVVTLKAVADEGSKFEDWIGCEAEPSPSECEVTVSEAKEVVANFEEEEGGLKFPLEVVLGGTESGKVANESKSIECKPTCTAQFSKGSHVLLFAKADSGFEFIGWTGCDAEPSVTECEVEMTEPRVVEAEFDVEHPELKVDINGPGKVDSAPDIQCPPTCSAKFDLDEDVTLTATPDEGAEFEGWIGCEAEPSPSECLVTTVAATLVAATFGALPGVKALGAHPTLYTEATLRGEVNPSGSPTEYRFEYLTQAEYEADGESFENAEKTPLAKLGSGSSFLLVEASLLGLEEGTRYRFRLKAMNEIGPAEDEGTFETLQRQGSQPCANAVFRFGLSANLPDCRAYELVTPAQTDGLTPQVANDGGTPSGSFSNWLTVQRSEGAGENLSYFTNGTLPGFEGNGRLDGYRAERTTGEGEHPPTGWQSALFSPDYAESAPGIHTFALQHGIASDQLYSVWESNPEPETFPETLPKGVYLRTPEGFEVMGRGSLGEDLGALSRYVSAGGTHAIFASAEHLESAAAPKGTQAIYDRKAGSASAEVVSVKPGGSPFAGGEGATYAGASEDGAAVAFSVGGTLFVHREGTTIEVAKGPNAFAGISEDRRYVFYATGGGETPGHLFRFDTQSESATEIAASGIFAGVSPDGSHTFFSSTEVLSGGEENENGEEAQSGASNLYAWDGTETRFMGRLSTADFENKGFAGIPGMNLGAWTRAISLGNLSGQALAPTRSTPGGGVFVFQSHARLSAYDNEGAGEIYRYDPGAEAGERLLCVSCDPSGAAPSGDALLEDVRGIDIVPLKPKAMVANLTDDGQEVFFQSFDRLLPEDANEAEDVYEWRANGQGGCIRQGGCLSLISSGQGETPSFLYAMSADGHDVFLQTREKLVGADVAGSPSIYDARVGGGIPEPTEPAPCQGDACQGEGSVPPVIPLPATNGAGETGGETSPVRKHCAKGKHRVKGRCVKVKKHRKRHRRRAHHNRGGSR
jgi:Divergent InlB B-repeat domain